MKSNRSSQIVNVLREIGTEKCLEKATELEQEPFPIRSLHFRDLDLKATDVAAIAHYLQQGEGPNQTAYRSISFSYNTQLGDAGVTALSKSLSPDTSEIGLVDCGIGDAGGIELLNWMRNSRNLRMVCIEQNNFSNKIKSEFRKFSSSNPEVLVVI